MFISLRSIALPAAGKDEIDKVVARLQSHSALLPGVISSLVAPAVAAATINAGQIIWRMVFATEKAAYDVTFDPAWQSGIRPLLDDARVIGTHYRNTRSRVGKTGAGIWRALVFRVLPRGFPHLARKLEQETLLMPSYISSIRSWGLNTVAAVEGPKAFTFVWEQEFDSLEGLTGEYMRHPVHWGIVDRYFDAECPEYVVDPFLLQLVCEIDQTVIS